VYSINIDSRNKLLHELKANKHKLPWLKIGEKALDCLSQCRPDDRSIHDTWDLLAAEIVDANDRLKLFRAMVDIQPVYNKWRPLEALSRYCNLDGARVILVDYCKSSAVHRVMSLDSSTISMSHEYWYFATGLAAFLCRCNAINLIEEMADDPAVCVVGVMAIALHCDRQHFARVELWEVMFEENPPTQSQLEAISVAIGLQYPKWRALWGIGALWDCLTSESSKYTAIIRKKAVVRRYLEDIGVS
jgi:hypothetical protein